MKLLSFLIALFLCASAAPIASHADQADRRGGDELLVAQRGEVFQPVLWQQRRGPGPQRPQPRRAEPLPPALLERLKNMTPEQRERVLQNNRRFQQLSPRQQEVLRQRLRQLQELTPEQRELIEQRFQIFSNLTPRQQEKARQIYERRWRRLPPERRRALLEEFRHLREMPPAERDQHLSSEDLQSHFSAEERDLLQQLIAL
jgi:DNA-directed RNA polymerase subunit F